MWLVNTKSLTLEFFSNATAVDYVILSHTWAEGEVTFQDMSDMSGVKEKKAGWRKIDMTCRLAQTSEPPVAYAWIDTCCIDKTSSTELSEAINAMFSWYKDSSFCIVYLEDFDINPQVLDDTAIRESLAQCRWFSRGWTLQELIAPRRIHFYCSGWEILGYKQGLQNVLSQITGVDSKVLKTPSSLAAVPVGRRLSWAALRNTTRVEDIAYSLLGIFDVNMPLLYGEGQKAFLRLQQEIARSTNDLSLFAWQQAETDEFRFRGIFAHSPREFLRCRYIKSPLERLQLQTDFALTNRGLRIESNLIPTELQELDRTNHGLILGLDCVESSPDTHFVSKWIGVYLWKHGSTYVRWAPGLLYHSDSRRAWMSSPPAVPTHITTVLSREEIETMHVQTKILIVSDRLSTETSTGRVERIVNTRGSFISFHILPIETGSGSKENAPATTNVAIIYGIQGDLSKRPQARKPWAMLHRQGQAPKAISNHVDDIFRSGSDPEAMASIAQDFVFANYSDDEGTIQDEKMPKQVDILDSDNISKIHRLSVSVEAVPVVLQFGQSTYNLTFKVNFTNTTIYPLTVRSKINRE